jgi:peroxiredoxin family protein
MGEQLTLMLHSGDHDKIYSALILGTGALAMGMDVSMYFTFYALERLKKGELDAGPVSRADPTGEGRREMTERMAAAKMVPLEQLMESYRDLGGRVIACEATMAAMGLNREALREDWIDAYGGVGQLVEEIKQSKTTLYI